MAALAAAATAVLLGIYWFRLREVALDDRFPHALPGGAFSSELAFVAGVVLLACFAAGAQTPGASALLMRTPKAGFAALSLVVAVLDSWAVLYLLWTAKLAPWPSERLARRWVAALAGVFWLLFIVIWFAARALDDSSPALGVGTAP